jgi:hypothetical protein
MEKFSTLFYHLLSLFNVKFLRLLEARFIQNKSRCYVSSFISSHRDKKFKIQRGVELALDKKVIQLFFFINI